MKKGVLLINLGTPDSPERSDVKTYLDQFLNDYRVIDKPANRILRKMLVSGIITPIRAGKSAALYKEIWTEEGSPLLTHLEVLQQKVQAQLGDDYVVEIGMRYQNPSMESGLNKLRKANVSEIIAVPLFPQYASSSTGSAVEELYKILGKWQNTIPLKVTGPFYSNPKYIQGFVDNAKKHGPENYEHVLFSFHGLPERHIIKGDDNKVCKFGDCCKSITEKNQFCYRANCFATARLIAKGLNIPEDKYTVAFQSRLGKDPWLKPYSDFVIEDLAKTGVKKILAFSPAFVADCLETLFEIGVEYQEDFEKVGGEKIQLVESLNDQPFWIDAVCEMITA